MRLAKASFDVVVNATPIGMAGQKAAPILEAKDLTNTRLVFDLVYNPLETPLIRLARQQGIGLHYRRGDVCPAGSAPVRDLDRETGS